MASIATWAAEFLPREAIWPTFQQGLEEFRETVHALQTTQAVMLWGSLTAGSVGCESLTTAGYYAMLAMTTWQKGAQSSMTQKVTEERLGWSVTEICHAFGLSDGFVRNEISKGLLNGTKLGRRVVVLNHDLQKYLADRRVVPSRKGK